MQMRSEYELYFFNTHGVDTLNRYNERNRSLSPGLSQVGYLLSTLRAALILARAVAPVANQRNISDGEGAQSFSFNFIKPDPKFRGKLLVDSK